MVDDISNNPKSNRGDKSHRVSSNSYRSGGKTVTFTVPTIPKPDMQRMSQGRGKYIAMAAILVLLTIGGGFIGGYAATKNNQNTVASASLSNQKKIVTTESQLISQIAKTVGPSVVSVNVSLTSTNANSTYGFFGFSQPTNEEAAGTGIILSSSGIIMTNRHVVPEGTSKVSITLSDGTELKDVSIIGRTTSSDSLDVAFLKVNNTEGHKLTPAVLGDSATVQVGDNAVAIGNALGQFQNTVTSGIISGYGRSVTAGSSNPYSGGDSENLDDLFQTDAAINEGNSGGPLVNLNGQVIGMNTAVAGNAQNIGFAIPINDIKGLIDQVMKNGKFERPYIGVRYIPVTADVATMYGLDVQNGAYIAPSADPSTPSVVADSPAAKAGLKTGDVITKIDGVAIDQTHSLTSLLTKHQPGDEVQLTVLRDGKTITVRLTLGTAPSN